MHTGAVALCAELDVCACILTCNQFTPSVGVSYRLWKPVYVVCDTEAFHRGAVVPGRAELDIMHVSVSPLLFFSFFSRPRLFYSYPCLR